jgi:transposase InsO family protein
MTSTAIAARLEMAVSTVGAVLRRIGLHRLARLEPPEPPNRYCRRHPGELIHIDIKRLSRFDRPGHRVTGRGAKGWRSDLRKGFEYCHVAIDDTSRVAYVEILPDQTGPTCVAFLERAIDWFAAREVTVERIMTDNGPGYRSKIHAQVVARLGIKHLFTRPYRPRTNGKAERFIQTLLRERAYGIHLPSQRPTRPSAGTVAALLQSPTTPRRPRSSSSREPYTQRQPEQPAWELQLANIRLLLEGEVAVVLERVAVNVRGLGSRSGAVRVHLDQVTARTKLAQHDRRHHLLRPVGAEPEHRISRPQDRPVSVSHQRPFGRFVSCSAARVPGRAVDQSR